MSPEEPVYCPTHSQDDSIKVGSPGAPVMIVRGPVEHSKLLPWLMLTSILAGFSVSMATLTFFYLHDQMLRNDRAYEQMRVQVLSQNAILQKRGFILPGDEWLGPEGNLEFDPKLLRSH
jgi:hypothetical protein